MRPVSPTGTSVEASPCTITMESMVGASRAAASAFASWSSFSTKSVATSASLRMYATLSTG